MAITTGGLVMLSEMLPELPESERKIANYILENPQEAITLTASELGKRSSTSSAAVIRLCKSLNLKGFQELKLKIAGDLQKKKTSGLKKIEPFESEHIVMEKVTSSSIDIMQETLEVLSVNELTKAVDLFIHADNIHFFGVGPSSIVAKDAQQKFLLINKNAVAFTDLFTAKTAMTSINEQDVVVGISFSGSTPEVTDILSLANEKGVPTMSVAKYGSSQLAAHADVRLFTSAKTELTIQHGEVLSRLGLLHIIDILFMCVVARQYDETITSLQLAKDVLTSGRRDRNKARKT